MSAAPDYIAPDPGPLEHALAVTESCLSDLSTLVPEHLDEAGDDAAVLLLSQLRGHRKRLAEIEAFAEAAVSRRLGKGKHTAAGFQVEVRGGGSWKEWRHDELAWQICRDVAVDPDTGEVVPEVVQIVDEVRSRLRNCARPSWRLTQLATYNIDPSDFATYERGRHTVTITEAVDE